MKWIRSAWEFVLRVGKRFLTDACPGRSAALAFSTLFALVPLSAFVVAVLTAFGAFDPLIEGAQQALIQQLVPAVHEEVFNGVRQFASNTRALGFLGFFIFVGTAILLLRNINTSFNVIWGFRTRRGVWAKVASYTTVIVFGTVLISASIALGPVVQTVIEASIPGVSGATWIRGFLVPPLLFFVAVFILNIIVPAGKVRPASAALGAGTTVIIWEVAKRIFVFWTTSVMRLNVIYGSLAVLPIFLIWLYLSWFFILIGVETTYVFQHRGEMHEEEATQITGPVSAVVEYCCDAALEIGYRHRIGANPLTAEDLDYRLGSGMSDRVRTSLSRSGLFLDTDHGLLPVRAAETITVGDLVEQLISHETDSSGTTSSSRILRAWKENPLLPLTSESFYDSAETV
jgi:YihY family inner membrane protein